MPEIKRPKFRSVSSKPSQSSRFLALSMVPSGEVLAYKKKGGREAISSISSADLELPEFNNHETEQQLYVDPTSFQSNPGMLGVNKSYSYPLEGSKTFTSADQWRSNVYESHPNSHNWENDKILNNQGSPTPELPCANDRLPIESRQWETATSEKSAELDDLLKDICDFDHAEE